MYSYIKNSTVLCDFKGTIINTTFSQISRLASQEIDIFDNSLENYFTHKVLSIQCVESSANMRMSMTVEQMVNVNTVH